MSNYNRKLTEEEMQAFLEEQEEEKLLESDEAFMEALDGTEIEDEPCAETECKIKDPAIKALFEELGVTQPASSEEREALRIEAFKEGHPIAHRSVKTDEFGNHYIRHAFVDMNTIRFQGYEVCRQKAEARRERADYVKRAAYTQNDIFLTDPVSDEHLQLMFDAILKPFVHKLRAYAEVLNRRLERSLRKLIPRQLTRAYGIYPDSIPRSPGFICRSKSGNVFYAELDMPIYFEPGTEYSIAKETASVSHNVDSYFEKVIDEYNATKAVYEKRTRSTYARLAKFNELITYLDVLKENPHWFDLLYTIVTSKTL